MIVARKSNGEFSFTMPDFDVEIIMETSANTMTLKENYTGNFDASHITIESAYFTKVDDMHLNVTPGAWVVAEPLYYDKDWVYEMVVTRDSDGAVLYSSKDKPLSFAMPDCSITITVTYAK